MRAPLEQLTQRLGLALPALTRSLLIVGSGHTVFAQALPRLEPLFARLAGYGIVLATRDKASWKRLGRERKTELVRLGPHRLGIALWMRRLRPRAVLALDAAAAPAWLRRACRRRGVPLLEGPEAEEGLARHLAAEPPADPRTASPWRPTACSRLANGPLARWLDRRFGQRLLQSPQALSATLGRPAHILCLGNGPSSLSPEAAATHHNLLLRVNWRWIDDPATPLRHRSPDLVLVGDERSVRRLSCPLFACQNRGMARYLLLRSLLGGRWPHFRLLLLEESFPELARTAAAKPTNGAWMVAVAAALQPAAITLAGIDLYSHPQGRYPWDLRANNAYARVHAREAELAFMRRALSDYRGDLHLLSDALAAALPTAAVQGDDQP